MRVQLKYGNSRAARAFLEYAGLDDKKMLLESYVDYHENSPLLFSLKKTVFIFVYMYTLRVES